MKDAITSRLQLFLAKIAGRDVSESTLTPPVIANMEEKLLDEIANRMDAVEEAASSGGGGERFEVVCTPTAQDFSGTMDKTMAEILEAYNAGCDIWFALVTSEGTQKVRLSDAGFANNITYPSFNTAFLYVDQNMLMKFHTGSTDQADRNTYTTTIYPLTPYDPNNSNM